MAIEPASLVWTVAPMTVGLHRKDTHRPDVLVGVAAGVGALYVPVAVLAVGGSVEGLQTVEGLRAIDTG